MNPLHLVVDWLYSQTCPKTTSNLALTCKFFSSPKSITTLKTLLTYDTLKYYQEVFHLDQAKQAKIAASTGNIDLLNRTPIEQQLWNELYIKAASNGQIDVLTWCRENRLLRPGKEYRSRIPSIAFQKAVKHGHISVFEWAKEKNLIHYHSQDATWWSAKYGNFEMVKYFDIANEWTCRGAAKSGRLDILQWALERVCLTVPEIQYDAASHGHLHILQWLLETGAPMEFETIAAAALETGHFHILLFVIEHGELFIPNEQWILTASTAGQFEMVKWLVSNYQLPLMDEHLWIDAVNFRSLEMLRLLYEWKIPLTNPEIVYQAAVDNTNFEILEWLAEHNAPTDELCWGAVHAEHPEAVLDWAKSKGIEPSLDDLTKAAGAGCQAFLQWAMDNGLHLSRKIWHEAARDGQIELLIWAKKQGIKFTKSLCNCASKEGQFQVLQWAHHNGIPWSIKVIVNAAEYGHKKMVRWAGKNYKRQHQPHHD